MEPKKARLAIALTLIIALTIIAVCLCLLFDYNPFPADEPEESEAPIIVVEKEVTPAPTAEPEPTAVPGPSDLKGASNDLYAPKAESYLPEYVLMVTYNEGGTVSLQYRPEKKEFSRHVIMELEHQTPVTAIAQENGYTLVLVKEGLAGWIISQELDYYS